MTLGDVLQGLGQNGINTVLARLEEAQARLHPHITDPVRHAIKTFKNCSSFSFSPKKCSMCFSTVFFTGNRSLDY